MPGNTGQIERPILVGKSCRSNHPLHVKVLTAGAVPIPGADSRRKQFPTRRSWQPETIPVPDHTSLLLAQPEVPCLGNNLRVSKTGDLAYFLSPVWHGEKFADQFFLPLRPDNRHLFPLSNLFRADSPPAYRQEVIYPQKTSLFRSWINFLVN